MKFESRADLASMLPAGVALRMGKMESFGHQAILAFVDGDRDKLASVVEQVATYDDQPGRSPHPMPRFDFAIKRVLDTVNMLFDAHDRVGGVSNSAAAEGARGLVEQYAPEQFHELALTHFAALPDGTADFDLRADGRETSEGTLLAVAAAAAWLGTRPNVLPVRQDYRQMLQRIIREGDADAVGAPERERVSSISDREARDFLDVLFPPAGSYPFPTDPQEWAVSEREVIGIVKEHLLATPAHATTPAQVRMLKGQFIEVLRGALENMNASATPPPRSAPPSRSDGQAAKKSKPKRSPRHKPKRRKK